MKLYVRSFLLLITMCLNIESVYAQAANKNIEHTPSVKKQSVWSNKDIPFTTTKDIFEENRSRLFYTNFSIVNDPSYKDKLVKSPKSLDSLDLFLNKCIQKGVFPGCQVFASKNGQIIYNKSFGYYTYDQQMPIVDTTLYDIASITKILATNLAVMKLVENGKIDLNATINTYLSDLKGIDKANILVRDLLLHQAGLVAWIPFYKNTLDSVYSKPRTDLYSTFPTSGFTTPVASSMYMKNSYKDTIWETILNSPLSTSKYVYSDLDFYFLASIVEEVSGLTLYQFLNKYFYEPLQLRHILFNPWAKGRAKECAPTEFDNYFRFQLVQGYVHDQGAAMMGGIAGHAGLFSNAEDIAVLMQLLNNGGVYDGKRYLKQETIRLFTKYNSTISRRGYGFDKPEKKKESGPTSDLCSKLTFGHQGFTGTCTWADPETGIVYVFLSNRVYPTANNRLINSLDVRNEAQSYIYKALGYGK